MQVADSTERILASPLAKRLARLAGVDLMNLAGTGPHGRIVKRDIEAAIAAGNAGAAKPARGANISVAAWVPASRGTLPRPPTRT